MSQIDQLIAELAPAGVEFKALGEVLRIKHGKDHKALGDGDIPVYGSGGIMRYADTAAAVGPSVLIPRKGSLGNLFYVEGPFWVVDTIFRTEIDTSQIEPKFVYYKLLTMGLGEMNQAGGVPSQTQSVLGLLRIPVPPLPVQREIVRLLDQLTALDQALDLELEAEFAARENQLAHVHDALIAGVDGPSSSLVSLRELAADGYFGDGDWVESKDQDPTGGIRLTQLADVGIGFFRDRSDRWMREDQASRLGCTLLKPGDVLIARMPEPLGRACQVPDNIGAAVTVVDVAIFRSGRHDVLARFVMHALNSQIVRKQMLSFQTGGTRQRISRSNLGKVLIALPSLDIQTRIVATLDRLSELVKELRDGLASERSARRRQFEHCREQLLTFEEAAA